MTTAQSYKRFGDEKYKNWLKTAESLSILRIRMEDFVEKETETYHSSLLKNKAAHNGKTCTNKCDFKNRKQKSLCDLCNDWKNEIFANHASKQNIFWDNCRPQLWPTNKWEVAKAYMSRGHREHCTFAEFDISAIFNLMVSCKHFNAAPKHHLKEVISVRNKVMHSPDFKMSNADREKHLAKVLVMAQKLEQRVPKLKDLDKEIKLFNDLLDKNFSQGPPCEVDGKLEDIQNLKEIQKKVLDREQQAMKEKFEAFFLQFEGKQDKSVKEQSQDLLDFLDQNDLQENFGPQVSKLKEMQEIVDQHEQKIGKLTERVDHLEQKKPDHPVLADKPSRYKNHLYEFARKKQWLPPVFTEEREAEGYKAKVEVNGQTFFSTRVWNSTKAAHQEVADIALQKLQADNTEEPSSSTLLPSLGIFFGKVTVVLDREVASGGCYSNKEEAIESAYDDLWKLLQDVMGPVQGQTYKSAIQEYFNKHGFQNPAEEFVQNDDDTTICKLRLSGRFAFHDTVGSTKKRQAEHNAAEVALKHLSKILNRGPISETEKNFKGLLKESLETLALSAPDYDTYTKDAPGGTSPEPSNLCVIQAPVKQPPVLCTSSQLPSCQSHTSVSAPASVFMDPQDSSSPDLKRKKARIDSSEIDMLLTVWNLKPPHVKAENIEYDENFKCTVEINLENFTYTNKQGYDSKKEAIRKTYMIFGCAMGIFEPSIDEKTSSAQVKQHFSQKSLTHPLEEVEGSAKPFCCSLKNITYSVIHEEQGPSAGDAKLLALKKALGSLSPLFDFTSLTAANSPEEVQDQLSFMLKGADQKDPVISLGGPLVKTSIKLNFMDHTITCTCKSSKRAARNHLSLRILGLLGVKTDSDSPSLRNRLNEWFAQQKLPQPVFEDTEEAAGAKATFSVQFTCCSPGWEDSWETAKKKLVEELKQKFHFLNDNTKN